MFDKDAFAELLEKAKGDRSINQYGKHCDVDPGYISLLLRGLRNQPPSADIINKLASRTYDGVTAAELMVAAGYISDPDNPREIADTVAPYLPEGFDQLAPEVRNEILDFVDYVMVKYGKKENE